MNTLQVLTPGEVQAIHDTALRILSEVGVIMDSAEARALLLDHGVVEQSGRLCLPPDLVQASVEQCPSEVTLQGRDSSLVLGQGDLHVHNLGGARDILDRPGGNLRPATVDDLARTTRLLDALDSVTTITPFFTPRDVPPAGMVSSMLNHTVRHTLKPINGPGVQSGPEARFVASMIKVVFGEEASVSLGVSPVSPLTFPPEIGDAIVEVARQRLPFGPLPCPQVGASAPMTLAGAVALQNAEVLACIVLAQLVTPGLPIIYCGRLAAVDMRTIMPIWGNPETGLVSAATTQVAHYYGLPVNVYGLCGSGNSVDIQSGYERAINALLPVLAGADEISGIGEMAGGVLSCPVQMVIDDEIMQMIDRIRRGFAVNEETLALEVTAAVMDDPMRMYLAQRHTVTHMHAGEVWMRNLGLQGMGWDKWDSEGRQTVIDRAQARVDQIMAEHEVPPLPDEQSRELDAIMDAVVAAGETW